MDAFSNTEEYMRDTRKHSFYPYAENGGTVMAIGGEGFAMIASDTRLTRGYSIMSREQSKCFTLTPHTMTASVGCWADVLTLNKVLKTRLSMYMHEHLENMTTTAIAQLLSTMLYWKRFFPYYVSNILAGLDENGNGVVYHYDPVGHMEKLTHAVSGDSTTLIQPLFDNQLGACTDPSREIKKVTKTLARQLMHDAFVSASERVIQTGDGAIIYTITKDGIEEEFVKLRLD